MIITHNMIVFTQQNSVYKQKITRTHSTISLDKLTPQLLTLIPSIYRLLTEIIYHSEVKVHSN